MKQFFLGLLVNILLFANFGFVFAEDEAGNFEGVIPRAVTSADKYPYDCHGAIPTRTTDKDGIITVNFPDPKGKWFSFGKEADSATLNEFENEIAVETVARLKQVSIGNKIKGGCVGLADIPIIIIKLIDLCTKLAGTIAVIFGLYAGYQMITSGITEDHESAKNTLKYAAIGLVVSLTAWIIVNVIQVQLTS